MIEYVEKGVLRLVLTGQLLYIVDNQHVEHLIEMDEIVQLALNRRILKLRLKLVHRDVQHLKFGMALPHLVADGLHDVGFAQS